MLDIKDIKTRDIEILNKTVAEMLDMKIHWLNLAKLDLLFDCVEKIPCQTHIFFDQNIKKWVFTDLYDEDLVSQEFFRRENFVIVETDLSLALARGIHYRYHKKIRG